MIDFAEMKELTFYFERMPVGRFVQSDYPTTDGQYRYMPYRGPGHYEMQTSLRRGDEVRCAYDAGGQHVTFAVRECPEYGALVLGDFRTRP
jgi:hypothetical protein